MNWPGMILILLKVSIVLNVLALGLEATFSDATCLFRRPRELSRAFLSMNVAMPLIALGLAEAFDLKPAVNICSRRSLRYHLSHRCFQRGSSWQERDMTLPLVC